MKFCLLFILTYLVIVPVLSGQEISKPNQQVPLIYKLNELTGLLGEPSSHLDCNKKNLSVSGRIDKLVVDEFDTRLRAVTLIDANHRSYYLSLKSDIFGNSGRYSSETVKSLMLVGRQIKARYVECRNADTETSHYLTRVSFQQNWNEDYENSPVDNVNDSNFKTCICWRWVFKNN